MFGDVLLTGARARRLEGARGSLRHLRQLAGVRVHRATQGEPPALEPARVLRRSPSSADFNRHCSTRPTGSGSSSRRLPPSTSVWRCTCSSPGLWTYLWASYRRLHPAACVFAGLVFMFCGAHFLQLYRGHLPNLRTVIWAPSFCSSPTASFRPRAVVGAARHGRGRPPAPCRPRPGVSSTPR